MTRTIVGREAAASIGKALGDGGRPMSRAASSSAARSAASAARC